MTESSGAMPPNKRSVANNDDLSKRAKAVWAIATVQEAKICHEERVINEEGFGPNKSRQWEFGDLQAVCRFAPLRVTLDESL